VTQVRAHWKYSGFAETRHSLGSVQKWRFILAVDILSHSKVICLLHMQTQADVLIC
jgi:hypothetical protein